MKIAIVINTSWNIYNFRSGLVHHFLKSGHRVVTIAPKDDYSAKLEAWGCEYHPIEMDGSGLNPIRDLKLLFQLRNLLKTTRPDLILSYTIKPNIYGSLVARSLSIPIICNVSGLGTVFLWTGLIRKLAVTLYRVSFAHSTWIFFQNDQDQAEFTSLVKIKLKKTSLLPGSGIDVAKYKVTDTQNETPVFLMIARLIVEKGIREFIEAVRLLKAEQVKAIFWLAGSLDEEHSRSISKGELDNWISEGLIVYFGQVDPIEDLIRKADAIVLPSYREGTPRTLLEGGALGKPLIATDVPGCSHVVEDGVNGFLCTARDARSLANKMKLFLALSADERKTLGRNSRLKVEETFDESRVIALYEAKISDLTGVRLSG